MIDLTGTEKQIAWAEDLRNEFNSTDESSAASWLLRVEQTLPDDRMTLNARRVFDAANLVADSKFWIDNRNQLATPNFKTAYSSLAEVMGVELIARKKKSA
jgi:hypothetical protein